MVYKIVLSMIWLEFSVKFLENDGPNEMQQNNNNNKNENFCRPAIPLLFIPHEFIICILPDAAFLAAAFAIEQTE
jgi:hypothetical protein